MPLLIDTVKPAAPSTPALAAASDSGILGDGITRVTAPALTGTAEPGSTVSLYVLIYGYIPSIIGTGTADETGHWTITPTYGVPSTFHIAAFATDAAGNVSDHSPFFMLTIDNQPPDAPGMILEEPSGSGFRGDDVTNDTTPTIAGFAEPGVTITLTDTSGGVFTRLGTAVADGQGQWSFTPATPLAEGRHTVIARTTDVAGNVSENTGILPLIIDTEAPAAPGSLALDPPSDSGVPGDNRTNIVTPTLTGTAASAVAEPGAVIDIHELVGGTRVLLGHARVDGNGLWSFAPSTPLGEGAHTFAATITDRTGNTSAPSAALTLVIDTTPPAAAIGPVLDPGSDSGVLGDRITSHTMPTLTGTAEPGASLHLTDTHDGLPVSTVLVRVDETGHWRFTPEAPLAEGVHTFGVFVTTDTAGNHHGPSEPMALTIDPAAPAAPGSLALAVPSDSGVLGDGVTSHTSPVITGTAEAGGTVTLTDTSGGISTVLGTAVTDTTGHWSFTPSTPLAEGGHGVTATATDTAGNTSAASAALPLTIDTTAPGAPGSLALAVPSDSGAIGDGVTSHTSPVIIGTAEAGSTVTLTDTRGGVATVLGTAIADNTGHWSFTPTSPLAEGGHSVTVTATDMAGNVSAPSMALPLTIDIAAPAAPGSLALAVPSDSGAVGDGLTNHTTPEIAGTAEAGSIVTLTDTRGGIPTVLGTAVTDNTGHWSFTTATPLAQGGHSVTTTATDAAGNTSAASAALPVTIDTTAPAAPGSLALAVPSDSGVLGDGVTNRTTPVITGTAEAGSTVTLTDTRGGITTVLGTALTDNTGHWSFTPVAPLAQGGHGVTATATDTAGNTSAASAALPLTIDTTAPVAPGSLALAVPSDSGTVGDGVTNRTSPVIVGTAESGSTVTLTDTRGGVATVLGTALTDNTGHWSFTPSTPLAEGGHGITATAKDTAGNVSAPSAPLPLTIDTTAPVAPGSLALAVPSDSGTVGDGVTNHTTPEIVGTAEAGSTVTLTGTSGGIPTVLGTAVTDNTGHWSFTPSTPLAEGGHGVTARATDAAGNVSGTSAALPLTIDSTAPGTPVVALADASDSGTLGDGVTNRTTPTLTGTAEAGGTIVLTATNGEGTITLGTALVDNTGHWSITPVTPLAQGEYIVTATARDSAGNTTPSAPLALTIDTTPPRVELVLAVPGGALIRAGQSETLALILTKPVYLSGGPPTLTLDDGGIATYVPSSLPTGSLAFLYTVSPGENSPALGIVSLNLNGAVVVDAAGNIASLAAALTSFPGLRVDTIAPILNAVTVTPSGDEVAEDGRVHFLLSGTEPVFVSGGVPALRLNDGGIALYDPATSTPGSLDFAYTPAPGSNIGVLAIVRLDLNGAAITDAAGNGASLDHALENPPGLPEVRPSYHPFAALVASNANPNAILTVTASIRADIPGVYTQPGIGRILADRVTYEVTGTAEQVNAALLQVLLTPARGAPERAGLTASITDQDGSRTSRLSNTGTLGSTLAANGQGDVVRAGFGPDTLTAGARDNTLVGGPGRDVLVGGAGGSTLVGGTGHSLFFTGTGPALIMGGSSRDTISAGAAGGNATISSAIGGNALIGLGLGTAFVNGQGTDTIIGGAGQATVLSAAGGNALIGLGSGTAVVNGRGVDTIIGGSGSAVIGIANNSFVALGTGDATISANQGSTVLGGTGSQTIGVREGGILLFAGGGRTTFIGGTGSSTVAGGTSGHALIFAGEGGGLFSSGSGGGNTIVGGQQSTTIFGGGGGDVLFAVGSAGTIIQAGSGNETLQGIGSSGADVFFAGSGDDLIGLGSGQDVVFAGTGASTVVAGTGRDIFAFANGRSGGDETIVGFKIGVDLISLQDYAEGEIGRALNSATPTQGTAAGLVSTTLTLSDNTRITFRDLTGVDGRFFR